MLDDCLFHLLHTYIFVLAYKDFLKNYIFNLSESENDTESDVSEAFQANGCIKICIPLPLTEITSISNIRYLPRIQITAKSAFNIVLK